MTVWVVLIGHEDDGPHYRVGGAYMSEKLALAALRRARDEQRPRDVYQADWWVSVIVRVELDADIMSMHNVEQRTWEDPLRADELSQEEPA